MGAPAAQVGLRPGLLCEAHSTPPDLGVREQIARRVLWLAVRMVDAANRDRDTGDGVRDTRRAVQPRPGDDRAGAVGRFGPWHWLWQTARNRLRRSSTALPQHVIVAASRRTTVRFPGQRVPGLSARPGGTWVTRVRRTGS